MRARGGGTILTPLRSARRSGKVGEPIVGLFPKLEAAGSFVRHGEITVIASAPGIGKSILALRGAVMAKPVPNLYLSAETHARDQTMRATSIATGETMDDVRDGWGKPRYEAALADLDHINFCFDQGLDADRIDQEMYAFATAYGAWPGIITVDSLYNVHGNGDSDQNALIDVLEYLQRVCRTTDAAIIVCHHLTGEHENGDTYPGLGALTQKIGKVPNNVLTLSLHGGGIYPQELHVCIAKNRSGKGADPSGGRTIKHTYDLDRMDIH